MLGRLLDWLLGWLSGRTAAERAGRAEQSNAQLAETLKEKEDARKDRERIEDGVKSLPPDDVLDRLR